MEVFAECFDVVECFDDAAGVGERYDVECVGVEVEGVVLVYMFEECAFGGERFLCQFVVEAEVALDSDVVGGVGKDHVVPGCAESFFAFVEDGVAGEGAMVFDGVEGVVFE